MKQESIDYLDKVACIANANMAYHKMTLESERSDEEAGAALLMSAYLEMYEHWQTARPCSEPPSRRVYVAADTCAQMRRQLQLQDRSEWCDGTEGLFQMMTAFMFLFKHMYVPQN